MNKGLLLITALALSSCAVAPVLHTFPNLGINVIRTSEKDINKICRRKGGLTDDGRLITNSMSFRGCWGRDDRTIYLNEYTKDVCVLLHEMCHADGTRTGLQCKQEFPC